MAENPFEPFLATKFGPDRPGLGDRNLSVDVGDRPRLIDNEAFVPSGADEEINKLSFASGLEMLRKLYPELYNQALGKYVRS